MGSYADLAGRPPDASGFFTARLSSMFGNGLMTTLSTADICGQTIKSVQFRKLQRTFLTAWAVTRAWVWENRNVFSLWQNCSGNDESFTEGWKEFQLTGPETVKLSSWNHMFMFRFEEQTDYYKWLSRGTYDLLLSTLIDWLTDCSLAALSTQIGYTVPVTLWHVFIR